MDPLKLPPIPTQLLECLKPFADSNAPSSKSISSGDAALAAVFYHRGLEDMLTKIQGIIDAQTRNPEQSAAGKGHSNLKSVPSLFSDKGIA